MDRIVIETHELANAEMKQNPIPSEVSYDGGFMAIHICTFFLGRFSKLLVGIYSCFYMRKGGKKQ